MCVKSFFLRDIIFAEDSFVCAHVRAYASYKINVYLHTHTHIYIWYIGDAHEGGIHAAERYHQHTRMHTRTYKEALLIQVRTCTQIEVTDRRRPLREVPTGHVFVIGQGEKVSVEKRLSAATFYTNMDRPTGGWCLCTEATRKYAWTLGLSGNINGYLGPASAGMEVLGAEERENVIIWRNVAYKACPGMLVCVNMCVVAFVRASVCAYSCVPVFVRCCIIHIKYTFTCI